MNKYLKDNIAILLTDCHMAGMSFYEALPFIEKHSIHNGYPVIYEDLEQWLRYAQRNAPVIFNNAYKTEKSEVRKKVYRTLSYLNTFSFSLEPRMFRPITEDNIVPLAHVYEDSGKIYIICEGEEDEFISIERAKELFHEGKLVQILC